MFVTDITEPSLWDRNSVAMIGDEGCPTSPLSMMIAGTITTDEIPWHYTRKSSLTIFLFFAFKMLQELFTQRNSLYQASDAINGTESMNRLLLFLIFEQFFQASKSCQFWGCSFHGIHPTYIRAFSGTINFLCASISSIWLNDTPLDVDSTNAVSCIPRQYVQHMFKKSH